MEYSHALIPLAIFSFATHITPGPNNSMLMASGANFGFRRSLPHIIGISVGFVAMLATVGLVLKQILDNHPIIFYILKFIGFAFILYLAYLIATSAEMKKKKEKKNPIGFWQAALFQWVNPKGVAMAVAVFSTYIPINAGLVFAIIACVVFEIVGFSIMLFWVLLGTQIEKFLKNDRARKVFNYTMAGLLVLSMIPTLFI